MKVTAVISTVLGFLFTYQSVKADQFSITLDPDDKYNLTWSFDSTKPTDYVTFTISCETMGWVGLGLSPNGGMAGSDIIVAWVDSNGKAHIKDMSADSNSLPSLDESQDVTLVSANEQAGKTVITFKRKIDACDSKDNQIMTSTTRLIYAYGNKDPSNNILSARDYHGGRRGAKSIYLLDPEPPAIPDPEDALYHEMHIENYEVPESDTTYFCKFFDPPALDKKHHITAVETLIHPGNEGILHHLILYACLGVEHEHIRNSNKTEGVCYSPEMPEFAGNCQTVAYAWAVGGSKLYYPENVGLAFGNGDTEKHAEYYMMEVHYDNPQGISGRIDSSGIRITYTPTLRQYDAASLTIGDVGNIFVPPQQEEFNVVSYCHSDCTNQWVPEGGVTMINYILHSHLLGVAIKVEWYRDGKAVGILAKDDHYDFNFQEFRSFKEPQKLLRGDTLKITCTYNSQDRQRITYGGLSSRQEMCLAFIGYYPKQELVHCDSNPNYKASNDSALYSRLSLEPELVPRLGYKGTLNNITDWTPERAAIAQEVILNEDHWSYCRLTTDSRFTKDVRIAPSDFPEIESQTDSMCKKNQNIDSKDGEKVKDDDLNGSIFNDRNSASFTGASVSVLLFPCLLIIRFTF